MPYLITLLVFYMQSIENKVIFYLSVIEVCRLMVIAGATIPIPFHLMKSLQLILLSSHRRISSAGTQS